MSPWNNLCSSYLIALYSNCLRNQSNNYLNTIIISLTYLKELWIYPFPFCTNFSIKILLIWSYYFIASLVKFPQNCSHTLMLYSMLLIYLFVARSVYSKCKYRFMYTILQSSYYIILDEYLSSQNIYAIHLNYFLPSNAIIWKKITYLLKENASKTALCKRKHHVWVVGRVPAEIKGILQSRNTLNKGKIIDIMIQCIRGRAEEQVFVLKRKPGFYP